MGNISSEKKQNAKSTLYNDKCDKYDYMIAVACGAIAGLIDVFMVGAPAVNGSLQVWTDAQVNQVVIAFAKKSGWTPRQGNEDNIVSAINYLERQFHVNYDQRYTADVAGVFDMSTRNHHMKSLAHSPDVVGLVFSVINQFSSTASFVDNGRLVTIQTDTFELQGGSYISKLYCGAANWFGHIMSDVAGSSGTSGRGSGIVLPFYEMFSFFDVTVEDRRSFAMVAEQVFREGYDARFGLSMAIPVILCDLAIKLIWALKHYFYHKKPLRECIPSKRHADLRMMLLIGDGTLCAIDGLDAALRSGGNWVAFFSRVNYFAWLRLAHLALREVCIRCGISFPLQKQLDAFISINEELERYLSELEKIDMEAFRRETEQYNELLKVLEAVNSEEEINVLLKNKYRELGFELPYEGDFDDFMEDRTAVLTYK